MAVLFPNPKTAKALGHNHCFPPMWRSNSASFCHIAECPFLAQSGLMSYGANISNSYPQAGIYAGKILKGAPQPSFQSCNPLLLSW